MKLIKLLKMMNSDEKVVIRSKDNSLVIKNNVLNLWVKYDILYGESFLKNMYNSNVLNFETCLADDKSTGIQITIDYKEDM